MVRRVKAYLGNLTVVQDESRLSVMYCPCLLPVMSRYVSPHILAFVTTGSDGAEGEGLPREPDGGAGRGAIAADVTRVRTAARRIFDHHHTVSEKREVIVGRCSFPTTLCRL